MKAGEEPVDLVGHEGFRAGTDIFGFVVFDERGVVADNLADHRGKVADGVIVTGADIHEISGATVEQRDEGVDEIVNEDKFATLVAIAPQNDRFIIVFAAEDLANEVKDEVHLATIGMITGAIKRGGNNAERLHAELFGHGELPGINHAFGHGIGEEAGDGCAGEVVFLSKGQERVISAACANSDEKSVSLVFKPPGEEIGIQLLVVDPLFTGVMKAEIASLSPGSEVKNGIESLIIENVESVFLAKINLSRANRRDLPAFGGKAFAQERAEKAAGTGYESFHRRGDSASTGK